MTCTTSQSVLYTIICRNTQYGGNGQCWLQASSAHNTWNCSKTHKTDLFGCTWTHSLSCWQFHLSYNIRLHIYIWQIMIASIWNVSFPNFNINVNCSDHTSAAAISYKSYKYIITCPQYIHQLQNPAANERFRPLALPVQLEGHLYPSICAEKQRLTSLNKSEIFNAPLIVYFMYLSVFSATQLLTAAFIHTFTHRIIHIPLINGKQWKISGKIKDSTMM